jgi:hypothetical protein
MAMIERCQLREATNINALHPLASENDLIGDS